MNKEKYKVGDRVYLTKGFDEIYGLFRSWTPPVNYPVQKKITQIVHCKDGTVLYQVRGGHFSNFWIGKIVFDTKEEAEAAMKQEV